MSLKAESESHFKRSVISVQISIGISLCEAMIIGCSDIHSISEFVSDTPCKAGIPLIELIGCIQFFIEQVEAKQARCSNQIRFGQVGYLRTGKYLKSIDIGF